MKKLLTKLTAALLVCFTVLTIVPVSALQVQAAQPKVEKRIYAILYPGNANSYHYLMIQNPKKNGKISNLKVEDGSVVELALSSDKKNVTYRLKKAGKTKISFKYAGKTLSTTISVEKWENPCSKFMLGKENLKKNFDKSGNFTQVTKKDKKITQKISVKAAPGWKIVSIGIYRGKGKKVKNNSKVTLDSSSGKDAMGSSLAVIFQNKKTGKKELLEYGYISYGKSYGGPYKINQYPFRDQINQSISFYSKK